MAKTLQLFRPHPNLSETVNCNIIPSEIEGGSYSQTFHLLLCCGFRRSITITHVVGLTSDSSTNESRTLSLFDFETQKCTELSKGIGLGWPNWSKSGQYIYFTAGEPNSLRRVRVSNGKVETVADLTNFRTTGRWFISLSLAPDDSPLLLRDASTSDVYALDWEEQ